MPPRKRPAGELPPEFLRELEALESAYLEHEDPIEQSGFGGGAERWRREREPILDAVDRDGDLLDVGCANGFLLECLVRWGAERGRSLTPFGLDQGARLIELARARFPGKESHFFVANAWRWKPPRRFRFVYVLWDCVPPDLVGPLALQLLDTTVERGGRLIIGSYGSRSRRTEPVDVAPVLAAAGLVRVGASHGGEPSITRFVWFDAP